MSILITGANGEIGIDLVKKLSNKYKILAIYRTKNKKIKKIKNVIWIKWDLKKKIKKNFKPVPKYIIHCAVDQKYLKKNKKKYIQSNYIIIKNLINFANKNKVKLIINMSSIDVYGDIRKNLLNENYYCNKPNVYGLSKSLSEQKLHKQKINFINLRLPGILSESNEKKLMRPWLKKIIQNIKEEKDIIIYNAKKKFNNVISTNEMVNLSNYLIKKNILIRDSFNFAASSPLSLNLLLNYVKKKLNSKSKIIQLKNSKNKSFYISSKKLENKINYKIPSTKSIIKKYLENLDKV